MINHIAIKTGFPRKLIGSKKIKLTKGLNVIFGPNGCGKTTLCRLLAAYCSCPAGGGWSAFLNPSLNREKTYAELLDQETERIFKTSVTADVDWDGTPTLFHMAATSDVMPLSFDGSDDGIESNIDSVMGLVRGCSSGERRIEKINIVSKQLGDIDLNALTKRPDRYGKVNDLWQHAMDSFIEFVTALPRTGPCTIILDEPERSVDVPKQHAFWKRVVPILAQKCQVIIATHCIFAVHADGNIIEWGENRGYVERCLDVCRNEFGGK